MRFKSNASKNQFRAGRPSRGGSEFLPAKANEAMSTLANYTPKPGRLWPDTQPGNPVEIEIRGATNVSIFEATRTAQPQIASHRWKNGLPLGDDLDGGQADEFGSVGS